MRMVPYIAQAGAKLSKHDNQAVFTRLPLSEGFGVDKKGWKVVREGTAESATTGLSPIVAWSFEELLRRALDGERVDQPPIVS